jgi:hypothetical protein
MMSSHVETVEPAQAAAAWKNWIQNVRTLSPECAAAVYAGLRIRRSLCGHFIADHPELTSQVVAAIKPMVQARLDCITYMAVRSTMQELGESFEAAPFPAKDAMALVSALCLMANAIECEIRKVIRAALPESDAWRSLRVGVYVDVCALLQVSEDRESLIRLIEQSEDKS